MERFHLGPAALQCFYDLDEERGGIFSKSAENSSHSGFKKVLIDLNIASYSTKSYPIVRNVKFCTQLNKKKQMHKYRK